MEGVFGIKEERTRVQWRRKQKKVEEEEKKTEEGVCRASSCLIPLKRERNLCVRAWDYVMVGIKVMLEGVKDLAKRGQAELAGSRKKQRKRRQKEKKR